MTLRRLHLLAAAAILFAGAHAAHSAEVKLLAPDGTLYAVSSGTAAQLGVAGGEVRPDDSVIAWSYLRQDGTRASGLVPGTTNNAVKSDLDLAYDEPRGALIAVWKEGISLANLVRLGILKNDQWTVSDLQPSVGFPHAYNPRMLLSHPVVHELDADGNDVWKTRSILHVTWWEVSSVSQARYASLFLDEDQDTSDVQVYDLPTAVGGGGPTPSLADIPAGAYLYPSLQLEGPGGGILATFADLAAGRHQVVRINYPTDLGRPASTNPTWLRRRAPIIDVANAAPIPRMAPRDGSIPVRTFIGALYRPTLAWRDDSAVRFLRFDGQNWSDVKSISLDDGMSDEKAFRLVQDMATKN